MDGFRMRHICRFVDIESEIYLKIAQLRAHDQHADSKTSRNKLGFNSLSSHTMYVLHIYDEMLVQCKVALIEKKKKMKSDLHFEFIRRKFLRKRHNCKGNGNNPASDVSEALNLLNICESIEFKYISLFFSSMMKSMEHSVCLFRMSLHGNFFL